MTTPRRAALAVAVSFSLGLVLLVGEQVVRHYPAEDGLVMKNGELLGGDFLAFYVGGRLFRENRAQLYDLAYQREFRADLLGEAAPTLRGELPFVYPPLVAALMSPFSRLSFQRSFATWTIFGLAVGVASLVLIMRVSGAAGALPLPLLLLFAFAYVPFSLNAVMGGQIAWLGLLVLATVSAAILRGRDDLAGVLTGLSYYKPPMFVLLLLVLCLARGRRFIVGFVVGAVVLMGTTLLLVGPDGLLAYVSTVSRYTYGQELMEGVELPPAEGMGLVALGVTLSSSMKTTLLVLAVPFLVVVWLASELLKRRDERETLFGLILCTTATVAFSLQCIRYDLALLAVPMVMSVAWLRGGKSGLPGLGLLAFLGFYFEFALRGLDIGGRVFNASSVLFVALVGFMIWQAWRMIRTRDEPTTMPERA